MHTADSIFFILHVLLGKLFVYIEDRLSKGRIKCNLIIIDICRANVAAATQEGVDSKPLHKMHTKRQ